MPGIQHSMCLHKLSSVFKRLQLCLPPASLASPLCSNLVVAQMHDCTLLHCTVQVNSQSGEDGAISTIRAAADPSLTGQGFKYLGPWYTQFLGAPLVIHRNNDSKHTCNRMEAGGYTCYTSASALEPLCYMPQLETEMLSDNTVLRLGISRSACCNLVTVNTVQR